MSEPQDDTHLRLIAATFFGGSPLEYVPSLSLGKDLTVLLGPNGSGKSTALRALTQNLLQPVDDPATVSGSHDLNADLGLLFMRLDDEVFNTLLDAQFSRLAAGHRLDDQYPEGFPLAGWSSPRCPSPPHGWRDRPVGTWLRLLKDSVLKGPTEAVQLLLDALADSKVVAVETTHMEGLVRAYWCLDAPFRELSTALASALDTLGLRGGPVDISDTMMARDAPVVAAPLGAIPSAMVPTIVGAPQGIDAALTVLRHSIAVHIETARTSLDRSLLPVVSPEPTSEPKDAPVWLEEAEDHSFSLASSALISLVVAERLVNRFLPPFLATEFKITLDISAVPQWRGGPDLIARVDLGRLPFGEEPRNAHSLDESADGHKLWLELALLETSRVLYASSRAIEKRSDAATSDEVSPSNALVDSPPATIFEDLSDPSWDELAATVEQQDFRPRLYVIDEPERNLHPDLERRAAQWLMEFSRRPSTQVVIATHSPRFLRLTGDIVWNFFDPHAGPFDPEVSAIPPTQIRTFRPHEHDAFGALAASMGYDRGELLTGVSLILFVEGESDMRVLHELFGAELHGAGVVIIPIHGAVGAEQKGVTDAEVLMRFTTAPVALLVDQLTADEVQRLLDDAAFRREALRARSAELRATARVIHRALMLERRFIPLSIPVHDIFDLLDEDLIRDRYPEFPGHSHARATAADGRWKLVYNKDFGIDLLENETIFEEIPRQMRQMDLVPSPVFAKLLNEILAAAGS